ncbi:hypothetical protein N9L19_00785 [bacterium]|nr:hypothetical protein [bacterium]
MIMNFTSLDEDGVVLEEAEDAKATGMQTAAEHPGGWVDATWSSISNAEHELIGSRTPAGTMATEQEIAADASEWSKSFACDARSCHAVNHDHDCTETCVHNVKKTYAAETSLPEDMGRNLRGKAVPLCRFRFFRIIMMEMVDVVRKVLRRGKALVQKPYVSADKDGNDYVV